MTLPAPSIEHRVAAQGRRLTRVEEDVAGLIEDVYAIRRTQIHDGMILKAIAGQMGLTLPTAEEVDAELERHA